MKKNPEIVEIKETDELQRIKTFEKLALAHYTLFKYPIAVEF